MILTERFKKSFTFNMGVTAIEFGAGKISRLGQILIEMHARKAFVITDKGVVKAGPPGGGLQLRGRNQETDQGCGAAHQPRGLRGAGGRSAGHCRTGHLERFRTGQSAGARLRCVSGYTEKGLSGLVMGVGH